MKLIKQFVLLCVLLGLCSCSTKGRVSKITPEMEDENNITKNRGEVLLTVMGGNKKFVSDKTFSEALAQTITTTGLFENAVLNGSAHYELLVHIMETSHSSMGGEHWTESEWMLRDDDEVLWKNKIIGTGKSMDLGGLQRIRKSAERSAKAVIHTGMGELNDVKLVDSPNGSIERKDTKIQIDNELCVVENPDVEHNFLEVYTKALESKGLKVKMLPPYATEEECLWTSTYSAKWIWDLFYYMNSARITLYHDNWVNKVISFEGIPETSAEKKIISLVDELIPQF